MRATSSLLLAVKSASAAARKVVPLADRILVRRIEQQAKVCSFFIYRLPCLLLYFAFYICPTIT
jgi:hypothetical protein